MSEVGIKNWKKISQCLANKTPVQCLHRWSKILKPGLTKGPWSIEEDRKLLEWVRMEGPTKWSQCADYITGRSGKQCRERWFNTLHPEVKKGGWGPEEDFIIFDSFSKFGSKWSKIAKELPGRTENSIKNRFYSTLRRISTESKKLLPSYEKCKSSNSYSSCPSLNELIIFFPQAFEEKKKLFEQYKQLNRDFKPIQISQDSQDPNFLHKKTSRKNTRITNNINNTFNVNVNIDQNLIQGLRPKQKPENLLTLEKALENFCGSEIKLTDNIFESLETKINKLIDHEPKKYESNYDEMSQVRTSGNDNYLNLLNQLSELEKILQITKQEIYQTYENNSKSSNENRINSNQMYDEKYNLFSPMDLNSMKAQNLFFPNQMAMPLFQKTNEEYYDNLGLDHLFKFN